MVAADTHASPGSAKARIELSDALPILLILAYLNGFFARITSQTVEIGLWQSLSRTFDLSVLVFFGMWLSVDLARRIEYGPMTRVDIAAIGFTCLLILSPLSAASWFALTGLSLYFLLFRSDSVPVRRVFLLVLALCFSGLWARVISRFFMPYILKLDTALVATVTHTKYSENLILAADGKTTLQVLEACSSFNNITLAFLGWIIARSYYGTSGIARSTVFVMFSCFCVVAINTIRIGTIALDPNLYELAHGPVGATVANIAASALIAAISAFGARK